MAGNENRKAALIAELARARAQIGSAATGVHTHLDVGARVQRALSRRRWWWIGGVVCIGVLLARRPARTKKIYVNDKGGKVAAQTAVSTGLALTVAKIAFDLLKPVLFKMVLRRGEDYVRTRWSAKE